MKYFVVLIAVAVLVAFTVPAGAETCFNEMGKCVQGWGKGCVEGGSKSDSAKAIPEAAKTVDALGNKTSLVTDNSGKSQLGI